MSREPKRKVALFVLVFSLIACVVSAAMYFSTTSAVPKSNYLDIPDYPQQTQQQTQEAILQFVSGTEYIPGQTGQVITEARFRNGTTALTGTEILLIESQVQRLYDNASDNSLAALWDATLGTCTHSGNSYKCSPSNSAPDGMVHKPNTNPGEVILGFNATLGLYQNQGVGGFMDYHHAWAVISDYDATFSLEGKTTPYNTLLSNTYIFENDPNGTGTYDNPYFSPGPNAQAVENGVQLYLPYMALYETINGTTNYLGYAGTKWTGGCGGFPETCTYNSNTERQVAMYVKEGVVTVYFQGNKVFEEEVEYDVSNKTVFTFIGSHPSDQYGARVSSRDIDEIVSSDFQEANVTNCVSDIWYPDKTVFLSDVDMLLNKNGNAYTSFTVPGTEGVYEYQTICNILGNSQTASKSFHVTDPGIGAMVVK